MLASGQVKTTRYIKELGIPYLETATELVRFRRHWSHLTGSQCLFSTSLTPSHGTDTDAEIGIGGQKIESSDHFSTAARN